MRALLLATLLCIASSASIGQAAVFRCPECDANDAGKIANNFEHIQEMRLYCLLHSFSSSRCRNSSEYMEFANPLLFDILQKNSTALLNILKKYPELYTAALHSQLQNPLLDFNINRLIFIVDSTNPKSKIKKKVLEDLNAIDVDDKGYPK